MNKTQGEKLLREYEAIDEHLSYREDKGILTENQKLALYLVQMARPFLKVLVDIAQSLESIANR